MSEHPGDLPSERNEFLVPSGGRQEAEPPIARTTCPSEYSIHLLHHFPFPELALLQR